MRICDKCQQGFHLDCYGLASIPQEDEWTGQGCRELQGLAIGQPLVLGMAQQLYSGDDPHLAQGSFRCSLIVLNDLQLDLIPPLREAQVMVEEGPILDSLRFCSCASSQRLKRVPNQCLQLAEQLYQCNTSQLTTVTLTSSRWGMLWGPTAAAGKASEAWVIGASAIQQALQRLQQSKQLYLLNNRSKAAARSVRSKRADAITQQGHVQGCRQDQMSRQQHAQDVTGASNDRPYQQQEAQQPSQQDVQSGAEQQLPHSMPFLQNGPLYWPQISAAVQYAAVQPTVQSQTTDAAAQGACQPCSPAQHYHPPPGHYPPWQCSYPGLYYGCSCFNARIRAVMASELAGVSSNGTCSCGGSSCSYTQH